MYGETYGHRSIRPLRFSARAGLGVLGFMSGSQCKRCLGSHG